MKGVLLQLKNRIKDLFRNGYHARNSVCTKNVIYDDGDAEICRGDLYSPEGKESRAVIFYIKGGLFGGVAKTRRKGYAARLADRGYTVFVPEYGEGAEGYEVCLKRLLKAESWLKRNLQQVGATGKMLIFAETTGAVLAVELILLKRDTAYRTARGIETTPIGFHGAVLFSSVWDLDKALAGKLPRALRKHLDQWNASTEDLGGIAPTSKITTFVPTFVAYNARVEPVNRQSKALLSRLRSIGIPIWEYCASYRNPPLNWQLDGSELSELLNRDVDAFVEQIMEGRPSPKYIEI